MNGLGYIWFNLELAFHLNLKIMLEERLENRFVQKWSSDINDSRKCILYKEIKSVICALLSFIAIYPCNILLFF